MHLAFKKNIKILPCYGIIFGFVVLFLPFGIILAQTGSGACSSHRGVDCGRGRQMNGTVYCNDGWNESVVEYVYVQMCKINKDAGEIILEEYMRDERDIAPLSQLQEITSNDDYNICMQTMYKNFNYIDKMNACVNYQHSRNQQRITTPSCPINSSLWIYHTAGTQHCICNEGYHNYGRQGFCQKGDSPWRIDQHIDEIRAKTNDYVCQNYYDINSVWEGQLDSRGGVVCGCKTGYQWNKPQTQCVSASKAVVIPTEKITVQKEVSNITPTKTKEQACRDAYGLESISKGGGCGCKEGYKMETIAGNPTCVLETINDQKTTAETPKIETPIKHKSLWARIKAWFGYD
ncbi:MAG: hypothetical protein HYT94_04885 [Parcubacteria group bacterium]|nr:hypothetical protein [Parcubacteria group bacterium]